MSRMQYGRAALAICLMGASAVVQAWAASPVVGVAPAPSNQVSVSWSPVDPGLVLQSSATLAEGSWVNVIPPALTNPVLLPASAASGFFRTYMPPPGMVYIPAGEFLMGDAFGDSLEFGPDSSERPVHAVHVSGFWMDPYEVSNDQVVDVFQWAYDQGKLLVNTASVANAEGDTQELLDLDWFDSRISWDAANETFVLDPVKGAGHPCSILLWHGAAAYCNFRSEKEGRPTCYDFSDWSCDWSAEGYRLPTEAEWERAARGGVVGRRFPWSDSDEIQHARANYWSSDSEPYDTSPTRGLHPLHGGSPGEPATSPAGSFAPNGYGLYDMAGNAWEWVWDWFDGDYYSNSPAANPCGPSTGDVHVARGGDAYDWASSARVSYRLYPAPGVSPSRLGTRTVLVPYSIEEPQHAYLLIDLSAGPTATNYPVSYLASVPSGGWTDEYKTTKLVMRRIPAGTFLMGSPPGELGRFSDETQHTVTLTKDFYIGVFEVTQRQWERVMGTWPSYFTNATYREGRPVERVSYFNIRENTNNTAISPTWPASSQVGANSFMGRLRAKTGLGTFDLPMESQWEYACRAGTTTALNSGYNLTNKTSDARVAELGRYRRNHPGGYSDSSSVSTDGATAKVGSYLPNAWGLYDMHGNVWEWCLDWYASAYPGTVTDPVGATSGFFRVNRGGSFSESADVCRSARRLEEFLPTQGGIGLGFRVAVPAQ